MRKRMTAVWPSRLRYPNGWLVLLRVPVREVVNLRKGELVEVLRPDGLSWLVRVLQLGELDGSDLCGTERDRVWLWNGEWRIDMTVHPRVPGHCFVLVRRVHEVTGEEVGQSLEEVVKGGGCEGWRSVVDRLR